jgi:hypothetical protein
MENSEKKIGFAIQGIKTDQFAILEENYIPKKEVGLATELEFRLDQRNKIIGIFLGLEFVQVKKVFLKLQVSCHFKIEETTWEQFISNGREKLVLPKGFLAHLAMITTGTARGILFAKTESTQFARFIIPTLNVAEMIKDDVSFDFIIES